MPGDSIERYLRQRTRLSFSAMYREYRDLVYATAFRVTSDHQASEDIAHEVFFTLLASPPVLPLPVSPRVYLITLAHQKASRHVRTEERRRRREAEAQYRRSSRVRAEASFEEIWDLLDLLEREVSLTLFYAYYHGLPRQEVAEIMGCSVRTVQRRLDEGRELLRKKFGPAAVLALTKWPLSSHRFPADLRQLDRRVKESASRAFPSGTKGISPVSKIASGAPWAAGAAAIFVVALLVLTQRGTAPPVKSTDRTQLASVRADSEINGVQRAVVVQDLQPRVRGTVLSWPENEPLGNVVVEAPAVRDTVSETVSDSRGFFEVSCPAENPTELFFRRKGFIPLTLTVLDPFGGPLRVFLLRDRSLAFCIVDSSRGLPIEGAAVSLRVSYCPGEVTAVTDHEGHVSLKLPEVVTTEVGGIPRGWPPSAMVLAAAPGFLSRSVPLSLAEESATWVIRLAQGKEVCGVVLDPTGIPVANARVFARNTTVTHAEALGGERTELLWTGGNGRFCVPLPEGASSLFIMATADGWAPGFCTFQAQSNDSVVVKLKQPLRAHCRIVTSEGIPLAGATFVIRPLTIGPEGNPLPAISFRQLMPLESRHAIADSSGCFTVEGLPPGTYQVELAEGGREIVPLLTLPSSGLWEGRLAGEGAVLCHIVDEQGRPLQRSSLLLVSADSKKGVDPHTLIKRTPEGGFRVEGAACYPCELMATAPGHFPQFISLTQPIEHFIVVLSPKSFSQEPAVLTLQIATTRGGLGGETAFLCFAGQESDQISFRLPLRGGKIRVLGLAPGLYTVTVQIPGFEPAVLPQIELPQSQPLVVPLRSQENP